MKLFSKYLTTFLLAFGIAGGTAYFGIRLYTQSAGEVVLPTLTGKNIIYVLETLTQLGLNVKLESTDYDDSVPRYAVIAQSPEPGATIKKGRNVTIFLSKGPKSNLIPDLRLSRLPEARILLEKNEFTQGTLSYTYSSSISKDKIIAQYPEPFSTELNKSRCDLLVSLGPEPVGRIMPDVSNMSIDMVPAVMERHDLVISRITSKVSPKKKSGIVLNQSPLPGSHISNQDEISLVVNAGENNLTMSPQSLNRMTLLTHQVLPGFLTAQVTVKMKLENISIDLYDAEQKPGETVYILIPSWRKSDIDILIDDILVRTFTIDPWKEDQTIGELIPWESLPLPSYQPTSLNLEKS